MHSSFKSRGGGPWGFGQILLRGVIGVVRKSRSTLFRVLLHFYDQIFWTLPPLLPAPPPPLVFIYGEGRQPIRLKTRRHLNYNVLHLGFKVKMFCFFLLSRSRVRCRPPLAFWLRRTRTRSRTCTNRRCARIRSFRAKLDKPAVRFQTIRFDILFLLKEWIKKKKERIDVVAHSTFLSNAGWYTLNCLRKLLIIIILPFLPLAYVSDLLMKVIARQQINLT